MSLASWAADPAALASDQERRGTCFRRVTTLVLVMEAAIRARGLTKRFGSRSALEDVTFDVFTGEVFGFLGPNGAGKTTTVRVLSTLVHPTQGTAEVAGIPVS